jgi:threonine synthase
MQYYSTRGKVAKGTAAEAIMKGPAPDGGLYVPAETFPSLTIDKLPTDSYQELAFKLCSPFLDDYSPGDLKTAIRTAYNLQNFDHLSVTPLNRLEENLYILELWHGPTYAFKDIALQILPHLMRSAIRKSADDHEIIILTATSGDTGKSALEGFRDIPGIRIIVYFPESGVSDIQKLQMVTQEGSNVHVAAVRGNFDDAQNGVKTLFNDRLLADTLKTAGKKLSSANSINWGRLLPQIVYYFSAYLQLVKTGAITPGSKINFVVPTGNFGNILAGYYAMRLGLPVNRLICAANCNHVLTDFIASGSYNCRRPLHQTLSPSMDILISSNLERLLFELSEHDPEKIRSWMQQLKEKGEYQVDQAVTEKIRTLFWSAYADDDETLHTIAETYHENGYLLDTHTAVGKAVYTKYTVNEKELPTVILSTASPFKFAGSVARSIFDNTRLKETGEFELLRLLARQTGAEVPINLADLEKKPIRHKQVITREAMRKHLLETLDLI